MVQLVRPWDSQGVHWPSPGPAAQKCGISGRADLIKSVRTGAMRVTSASAAEGLLADLRSSRAQLCFESVYPGEAVTIEPSEERGWDSVSISTQSTTTEDSPAASAYVVLVKERLILSVFAFMDGAYDEELVRTAVDLLLEKAES